MKFENKSISKRKTFRVVVLATMVFASLFCFWQALALPLSGMHRIADRAIVSPEMTPVSSAASDHSIQKYQPSSQAIESIRVGQRVWVDGNPSEEKDRRLGEEVVQSEWQKMVLLCPKKAGEPARVEMLRPIWWLKDRNVQVGGKVYIEVPECGIEGFSDVLAVEECPPIDPGFGRTVISTFHHAASQVVDVSIEGCAIPIGATPNHLFWSESEKEFVPAIMLRSGDSVSTITGTKKIADVQERGPPASVFNIEVHGDHVYRIGKQGVLVHNSGICPERFAQLRGQVQALKNIGVATKAERRAFFNGSQVQFRRSGPLGYIDGFVQRNGSSVRSVVFSANGRDAAGNLLKIGDAPVRGGTGMRLFGRHRTLSQNLGNSFGANQVELGGMAVVNDDLLRMLDRLGFEARTFFSPHFGENIPFLGRTFGLGP